MAFLPTVMRRVCLPSACEAGHLALGGADDVGVVAAAEAAVAGDDDEGHRADLLALLEEGGALAGAGGRPGCGSPR